ncbi:polysaccharide biosynthesis tyrosine autokinase [uncultured Microbacterium sp.]|uniref:polysaccharide biosynthesis tyrosine autokinase n=1 Tax=uncultured Microbacterium sp. TaxID=191216 RepID=UPI0025F179E6|nr:polysaccharide biosynthesis tyrosine autokinase [uncultured Microbacterium sp.]
MGIREYGRLIRRGWLIISVFVAVGLAGAAAVTVTAVPEYRAQTTMIVSLATVSSQPSTEVGAAFASAEARVASYVALATSPSVLEPVVSQLNLDMSVADLAEEITAAPMPNTAIMTIDVVDADGQRAAQIADTVAASLTRYVEQLESPADGGTSRVSLRTLESAPVPAAPLTPDLPVYLLIGGATGLILGVGVVALRHLRDGRIHAASDVTSNTDLAIIETVPFDATLRKGPALVADDSAAAESFRMLRTTLLFAAPSVKRVVLVTSARDGDGKSVVVANLAASIAQLGRSVLVIDANLRAPAIGGMFDAPRGSLTLAELLNLSTTLPASLGLARSTDGVDVLVAGRVSTNPSNLIGTAAMERVMKQLAQRYDHILIDSPAVLTATDAVLLSKLADATLLVAGVGVSGAADVVTASSRLRAVRADVLGAVVSREPKSSPAPATAVVPFG